MTERTRLRLRTPRPDDEAEARAAQRELAADGFDFGLWPDGERWPAYLARLERERTGTDLPPDRVRATLLYADVVGDLVGRVGIRFALNPVLTAIGGHLGYAVRPAFRGRGHAHHILAAALPVLQDSGVDRALVTCDDDNVASRSVIERAGGRLDPDRPTAVRVDTAGGGVVRRYWIDLSAPDLPAG